VEFRITLKQSVKPKLCQVLILYVSIDIILARFQINYYNYLNQLRVFILNNVTLFKKKKTIALNDN
jgi:hypothetical protein